MGILGLVEEGRVSRSTPLGLGAIVLVACSTIAHAIPVQLNEADFASSTADLPTVSEDFEGVTIGHYPSPYTFVNGTYTDSSEDDAAIADDFFCGATGDQCLTNGHILGLKTIDALPSGTTYWGAEMSFIDSTDSFEVSVIGGSGVFNLTQTGSAWGDFLGFHDPLGISSLEFTNHGGGNNGTGNWSWDNVTTAVPEPFIALLLGTGVTGLGLRRRRL